MGHGNRESCRNFFRELHILPLMSQYILSLLTFVSNNREQYFANSEIHNINTRHTTDLHLPRTHLSIYQKGVYYSGIKIFNSLPKNIKKYIDNPKTFKKAVKNFYTQTPFTHYLNFMIPTILSINLYISLIPTALYNIKSFGICIYTVLSTALYNIKYLVYLQLIWYYPQHCVISNNLGIRALILYCPQQCIIPNSIISNSLIFLHLYCML